MTIRHSSKRSGSLEAVLATLPDRLREAEVYHDQGTMTGLAKYMRDLAEHLREELNIPEDETPPTVEAMTAFGIPPSEWYRALLTQTRDEA